MKKEYQVPEAVVIVFENSDLLKLSADDEGDKYEMDW